jgi:Kef-type K+ transport system membrane component KefB
MAMWLLQLAIIIMACRWFGWLAERVGQSRVVGEIVAGIVLGPSVVGAISPAFYSTAFGPAASSGISQLGETGVVMLMFQVGLHLDFGASGGLKAFKPALLVAVGGMIFPFVTGMAAAIFSWPTLAPHVSELSYVLFCGIALSVSAVPVMAKMVLDLRLTQHPAAKLALSAAMFTDLAGWIMLAVIASMSIIGTGSSALPKILAGLVAFVVASVLLVRFVVRPITAQTNSPGGLVAVIVPYVLASAWASAALGFHSVFGSLAAAILLRGIPDLQKHWDAHFDGFVRVVLLPVFFAYAGLHVSLTVLSTSTAWLWFAIFFSIAFVGKFGGSYLGARVAGVGPRDSAIVGSLMNTRGLMELVVLSIGLKMHVLPQSVYAILVTIALVTTAMTVPFIRLLGGSSDNHQSSTSPIHGAR